MVEASAEIPNNMQAKELPPVVTPFLIKAGRAPAQEYVLPLGGMPFEEAARILGGNSKDTIGFSQRIQRAYSITRPDGTVDVCKTDEVKGERETIWLRRTGEEVGFVERDQDSRPFDEHFSHNTELTRLFRDASGWYHEANASDKIIELQSS